MLLVTWENNLVILIYFSGFTSESINIILGVMIGVVAALVFVAAIAVFVIRMREEERESSK